MMQYAIKDTFRVLPPDEKIWKSLQNKDLPRAFWSFLWKVLHNAHKVGEYWENIPNWEHRSVCNQCDDNTTDNLEHIMFSCKVIGQEQVW